MRFTIKVDEDWLDILESLANLVADQDDSSPEEALEKAIFAQINHQRTTSLLPSTEATDDPDRFKEYLPCS